MPSATKPGVALTIVVTSASHAHGPAFAYHRPAGSQRTSSTAAFVVAPRMIHATDTATPVHTNQRILRSRPSSRNWKPAPAAAAIGMNDAATRNSASAAAGDVIDGPSVIMTE